MAKLPGVKVAEEEKVPETADVQKTMGSMITLDGATLLFPTSFGYFDPHVLKAAAQYPQVTFLHAGGLYQEGKHPKNVGSYFGYIDEAQYLAGIVAGHTSRSRLPQRRLAAYQGEHGMLTHWRQHANVLLGPSGPRAGDRPGYRTRRDCAVL